VLGRGGSGGRIRTPSWKSRCRSAAVRQVRVSLPSSICIVNVALNTLPDAASGSQRSFPARTCSWPRRRYTSYDSGDVAVRRPRRHAPGASPTSRLKARLNAASDWYPTAEAA